MVLPLCRVSSFIYDLSVAVRARYLLEREKLPTVVWVNRYIFKAAMAGFAPRRNYSWAPCTPPKVFPYRVNAIARQQLQLKMEE